MGFLSSALWHRYHQIQTTRLPMRRLYLPSWLSQSYGRRLWHLAVGQRCQRVLTQTTGTDSHVCNTPSCFFNRVPCRRRRHQWVHSVDSNHNCAVHCSRHCVVRHCPTTPSKMHVIPVPLSVQSLEGSFLLKRHCSLFCDGKETESVVKYLTQQLASGYGLTANVERARQPADLVLDIRDSLEALDQLRNRNEGYVLRVSSEGISIRAVTREGLFRGIQTFLQLLTPHSKLHSSDVEMECLEVGHPDLVS